MSKDLHNIDDLFRKGLEENQDLPGSSVWDKIDKALDRKKVVSISKKYNKLKWAAAVLLLFSIGMAMYTLHIRKQNRELVRQNAAQKNIAGQNSQPGISAKDSAIMNNITTTPGRDASSNTKLKQQSNRTDSITTNIKEEITSGDLVSKDQEEKKSMPNKKLNDSVTHEKANAGIALRSQNNPLLKNNTASKTQVQAGTIDLANATVLNDNKSTTPQNNKTIIVPSETKSNSVLQIASDRQKNIETASLAPQLNNDLTLPKINPSFELNKTLREQAININGRKTSFSKNIRLSPRDISLFSATLFFSPDLVSTDLKDDHPRYREEERNAIEKDEQIKFSSTFGILLDYTLGKRWKLESGITYSTRKTDIHPKTIYARPDNSGNVNYRFNCSAGYSYVAINSYAAPLPGDSINALASANNLQYIGLPFYAKYVVTAGRFTILPGAGVSFNFLTKGQIETTIATSTGAKNSSTDKIQGLKSMYLNGLAGIGLQYKLNKMFSLSFEPTYRFALSPINKDASVKTNLNSIGLSAGLVFKL
jgi:Outer membrane protein beta-barrel domain